jgi:hypothetical protein
MAKVSLTLPSINQKLCELTINKILAITRDVDYEIVVVSPFEIRAPKVKWVLETERMGNLAAHQQAYLHSQGELIVTFTDDIEPAEPDWLKNAHDFYLTRSKLYFPYACGLNVGVFHIAYGRLFPTLPVISRQSIEKVGAYYDLAYRSYYGDPDLGLRVWAAGGRCESSPKTRIRGVKDRLGTPRPRDLEPNSWFQEDLQLFINRWHDIYGTNWGTQPSEISKNLPLRFLREFGFCEPNPAIVHGLIRRRDRHYKMMRALSSVSRRTGVNWPLQKIKQLLGTATFS